MRREGARRRLQQGARGGDGGGRAHVGVAVARASDVADLADGMFCRSMYMRLSRPGSVSPAAAAAAAATRRRRDVAGRASPLLLRRPPPCRLLRFRRAAAPAGLPRFGDRLALVADRKLELATLRKGAGSARRKRCDLGSCVLGGGWSWREPMASICEGGIHGASRCTLPRMCCGMRSAVARA